jgi:hypothetical protein
MDLIGVSARIRGELRDLVELVLIPAIAIFIPWPLCYRVFCRISRWERPYYVETTENCAKAAQHGYVTDQNEFRQKWRLVSMIDQADFYLAITRSNRWLEKYVDIAGSWPLPGRPGMLLGFHWGVGMWALRHLTATGLRAHALIGPQRKEMYPGRRLRYEYYRLRNIAVRQAMQTRPLDVTASLRGMLTALRDSEQVLAIVDVPSYLATSCHDIKFLGQLLRVPRGVFRLAVAQQVPVTVFTHGVRFADGRRFIRIYQLGIENDVELLIEKVFSYLEELIREEPAAWHFWRVSDAIFVGSGEHDPKP